MSNNTYLFQFQDTVVSTPAIINPLQSSGLIIERNKIDLGTLRNTIDSVRKVEKPKPKPIVRTEPVIPVNDTIDHPTFDVFTGKFIIQEDKPDFFDELHIRPFNPAEKNVKPIRETKEQVDQLNLEKTFAVKENITKENLVVNEKSESVGFLSTDWMLGVIIFALILFGWLRVGYNRFFRAAVHASYNYFAARRIFEEANVTRSRVFYFMNLLFFISISLFVTQYMEYQHISIFKIKGILLFAIVFCVFILIYALKSMFLLALDFVFLTRGGFSSYVFTVFLYNKIVGFILLPIVSVLPFVPDNVTPWLFVAGGAVFIFLYLFRVLKGIQLCFKNRVSIFYLFLYLCALEILPVLILLKIVSSYY